MNHGGSVHCLRIMHNLPTGKQRHRCLRAQLAHHVSAGFAPDVEYRPCPHINSAQEYRSHDPPVSLIDSGQLFQLVIQVVDRAVSLIGFALVLFAKGGGSLLRRP